MKAMIPKQRRRMGDAADSIFTRHGQGRPGFLAYSALSRLAFPLFDGLSRFTCLEKETAQTLSKVDMVLRCTGLLLSDRFCRS